MAKRLCLAIGLTLLWSLVTSCQTWMHQRGTFAAPYSGVVRGSAIDLAYLEWPGEGPPLVLLHGLGGNALWWAGLAHLLPGRHVIAIDLPGHGQSLPVDDWALVPMAGEIATVVANRWRGPVVWGGHSWGGKLVVLAAASRPTDEIAGIALLDPVPLGSASIHDVGALADFLFAGELGAWSTLEEAVESVRQLPAYRKWTPELELAFRRGVQIDEQGMVRSRLTRGLAIQILQEIYGLDAQAYALQIAAPVLLLMAEDSRAFQTTNLTILSRAQHVFVPGNHWIHVDNVEDVAVALSQWLVTISRSVGSVRDTEMAPNERSHLTARFARRN
jgi:pimeloyl-ACP methyl ester carboxylesterase